MYARRTVEDRSLQPAVERYPAGVNFVRPRNGRRPFPTARRRKISRRGVLRTPAERSKTVPYSPPSRDIPQGRASHARGTTTGRSLRPAVERYPVGACFARPRNDHRSFPTARRRKISRRGVLRTPAERPQVVPYGPPSRDIPQGRAAHASGTVEDRSLQPAIERYPVGACFARPRNGRRPFPTARHQKISRRGALRTPAERSKTVPYSPPSRDIPQGRASHARGTTTGRSLRPAVERYPVGACFARPRNDHRSFPTARHRKISRRGVLCTPAERSKTVPYRGLAGGRRPSRPVPPSARGMNIL